MATTRNPETTPARTGGDRRPVRPAIPAPRRPAEDDRAPSTGERVPYPPARYALDRLAALRRPAADGDPDGDPGGDRGGG
ncbi:hypothetical protein ACI8AC_09970 [Geodermatophilus sp. SYSU D00758]